MSDDDLEPGRYLFTITPEQAIHLRKLTYAARDMAKAIQGLLGPHDSKKIEEARQALEAWKSALKEE